MSTNPFGDGPGPRMRQAPPGGQPRSRALVGTVMVLILAFFVVSVFTGVWTDRLWFNSVDYGNVFTKVLGTRILLFLVFGLLMALAVGLNIALAYRFRPLFRPASAEQVNLDRYREAVDPLRRLLLLGVAGLLGLFAGGSGAGQWRQYLLWRNGGSFGTKDASFGRDVGFYVFDLPWLHYLVDFAMTTAVLCLIAAGLVHYLFGGIRLQARTDKLSSAAQVQISVLAGIFVLFKAADFWLDRFNLTSDSRGLFTGIGFTDTQAVLPAKAILTGIAVICALLFFANVLRRTWMLPSIGLALLVLSSILLGVLWPGIVQQFQVNPSEPDKEAPYLRRNIQATRAAYDIASAEVINYNAKAQLAPADVRADSPSLSGVRLQDPALVSEAFQQLQQVRGYYSVPPVLDVDRYEINGRTRDIVLAARELNLGGLPDGQRNWALEHTVYTHGYGLIAAYGNQANRDDQPVAQSETDGNPVWAEQNLPPVGDLTELFPEGYEPRIYYGENSPEYSVVGKEAGGRNIELDLPDSEGSRARNTTYAGSTGVSIGNLFNQVLYAVKFSEPNIVLSNRVNGNSEILYDRAPRERVQKVAPWLTVDDDSFPAVVDGKVKWILDGYTTTDRYPNSEKDSLRSMTSDALSRNTTYATLPTDEINYMRNSVKAVVDAYDGTVDLYEWTAPGKKKDPILSAWQGAFPGAVKKQDDIPAELLEHMRYPEDLFKVQRNMLAAYHVTDPKTFYAVDDLWKVPEDPEIKTNKQPPYRLSVKTPEGGADPVFSLTSVFVPNKRQNLASFISVDSDASQPGYGKIRILRLPSNTQVPGPSQIANSFGSDSDIQNRVLPFTRSNAKVIFGNLLTLPVGDGLLYAQPLYTQRSGGEGTYPQLRFVLASFGNKVGIGTTLQQAIDDATGTTTVPEPTPGSGGTGGSGGAGDPVPQNVRTLLERASAKFGEAQRGLSNGNLTAYAQAQEEAQRLVEQALRAANAAEREAASRRSPSPSASPSGSPSPSGQAG